MFTTTGAIFAHNLGRANGRKYLYPERSRIAPSVWWVSGILALGAACLTVWTTLY